MSGVVLITGASTGVGASVAVLAAKAGYRVYASMRDVSKRDLVEAAAEKAGVALEIVALDVTDSASVNSAVAQIIEIEGRIDFLVANAGVGFVRSTEQASEADVQRVMDVNFTGVVRCVKAVLPHMRAARSGHVIAISSVGGLIGQPFNEIYCASKFAVEGYIEGLASYVGPAFGLHFTAVEPGGISTEFVNSVLKQVEGSGGFLQDEYLPLLQRYLGGRDRHPEGIMQTADEVAAVVLNCMAKDVPPVRTRTSEWSETFTALKTASDPDGLAAQAMVLETMLGGSRRVKAVT